jgi:D-glycero-D-manno-heptose 1,7-bisphosphate phosphatase
MSRARAVFFDRDGTLMEEVHYCGDPARVRVFPGVPEALRKLKQAGFRTFVVTNQSGIGRGLITEAQYHAVEAELLRQIGTGVIDATYFCADPPAAPSTRRKPEPGMVLEAAAAYDIDLARSYFIGDKSDDMECGHRAGTRTILVLTGYGAQQDCRPDFTARDVTEAVEIVLRTSAAPESARESPRISGSRPWRHRPQL